MEKKRFGEVHETTGIMNFSVTGSMLAGDAYREQSAYKAGDAPGKIAFSVSPKVHITAVLG